MIEDFIKIVNEFLKETYSDKNIRFIFYSSTLVKNKKFKAICQYSYSCNLLRGSNILLNIESSSVINNADEKDVYNFNKRFIKRILTLLYSVEFNNIINGIK